MDEIKIKSQKLTNTGKAISFQYKGEFRADVLHGFGLNKYSSNGKNDMYRGQFDKDEL